MKVFKILTSLVILLITISISGAVFAEMPEFSENESVYLIENSTNDIILNNQADEKINSGEINRLMAVLVSLDLIGNKLSDKVIVGEEINDLADSANLTGLEIDQEVSYQDLLSAILLTGSPDATQVLVYNIGSKIKGENKSDGSDYLAAFLNRMNDKAKELELKDTNFSDIFGIQDDNKTSTKDLIILAQNLYNNESIKKILSLDNYSIKLPKTEETKNSETDDSSEEEIETNVENPTIEISNRFLPILTAGISNEITGELDSIDNKVSENQKNGTTENETLEDESISLSQDQKEDSNRDNVSNSNSSTKTNSNKSNLNEIKAAFIANENTDSATIIYEAQANEADIIGCISGLGAYSLAEQINNINSELASNYSFKDVIDENGNLGTFKLSNTGIFSKKKIDLTVNDDLKVFVPDSQKEAIKTNIIWDKNIINQEGDKYTLVQSVDPGMQVAQLEISKGDVKRLVPLYSSTKASIKSWRDSVLLFLFWFIVALIPLLLIWRIIYVRNKRRAMRRRRALRKKKRLAIQNKRNQEIDNSSPINRMAHNI